MKVTCMNTGHPCSEHHRDESCLEPQLMVTGWTAIILGLVLVVIGCFVGWWFSGRAYGAETWTQPYGGCDEGGQAPHSAAAAQCRAHGWTIRADFTVGPRGVLRAGDLHSCKWEDGDEHQPCSWNWPGHHDGNGYGLSYWIDRNDRFHYIWPVDPRGGGWRWMTAEQDRVYDAASHPNRWTHCVILTTEDTTSVRCADGEQHSGAS